MPIPASGPISMSMLNSVVGRSSTTADSLLAGGSVPANPGLFYLGYQLNNSLNQAAPHAMSEWYNYDTTTSTTTTTTTAGPTTTTTTTTTTSTTTTTTTLLQVWYALSPCAGGAGVYTSVVNLGTFTAGDIVRDTMFNYYTVGAYVSVDPGGTQISAISTAYVTCPTTTTTTTTAAPTTYYYDLVNCSNPGDTITGYSLVGYSPFGTDTFKIGGICYEINGSRANGTTNLDLYTHYNDCTACAATTTTTSTTTTTTTLANYNLTIDSKQGAAVTGKSYSVYYRVNGGSWIAACTGKTSTTCGRCITNASIANGATVDVLVQDNSGVGIAFYVSDGASSCSVDGTYYTGQNTSGTCTGTNYYTYTVSSANKTISLWIEEFDGDYVACV